MHKILYILTFLMIYTSSGMVNAQDLSKLYEKVSPAVVVIVTSEKKIIASENHIWDLHSCYWM